MKEFQQNKGNINKGKSYVLGANSIFPIISNIEAKGFRIENSVFLLTIFAHNLNQIIFKVIFFLFVEFLVDFYDKCIIFLKTHLFLVLKFYNFLNIDKIGNQRLILEKYHRITQLKVIAIWDFEVKIIEITLNIESLLDTFF